MDDDLTFQNMDSWHGSGGSKFGLSFKQIILNHINRTVLNGSVEFRGGYSKEIFHGNTSTVEYVPDSREVFCNSVRMLRVLLLCHFDKAMEKTDKEFEEEFQRLEGEYETKKSQEEDLKKARINYQEDRIELHIKLFEELVKLSKRLNFFEEQEGEAEVV